MRFRSIKGHMANLAVAGVIGVFAFACSAYSGCMSRPGDLTEAETRAGNPRFMTGQSAEEFIRTHGEDPVELMTPTDREPNQK